MCKEVRYQDLVLQQYRWPQGQWDYVILPHKRE